VVYGPDGRDSVSGKGKIFLLSIAYRLALGSSVQTGSGVHQVSYPMDTGALSPGVKWPGRDADHSPPSSAEVKKGGALLPLPPMPS
jgi:hypothetical protein